MAVQDGLTGNAMTLSFVTTHTVSDMQLQRLHLRFNVVGHPIANDHLQHNQTVFQRNYTAHIQRLQSALVVPQFKWSQLAVPGASR